NCPPSRHRRLSSQFPPHSATVEATDSTSPGRSVPITLKIREVFILIKSGGGFVKGAPLITRGYLKESGIRRFFLDASHFPAERDAAIGVVADFFHRNTRRSCIRCIRRGTEQRQIHRLAACRGNLAKKGTQAFHHFPVGSEIGKR